MNAPLHFEIGPLSLADAIAIASWRYSGDYALYNTPAEGVAEASRRMLEPASGFRAVRNGRTLSGFCSFGADARVSGAQYPEAALDIGAGMDPALAGRGHGRQFIGAIIRYARADLGADTLRATVASWNQRALRVVCDLGFRPESRFARADGVEFTVLILDCREVDLGAIRNLVAVSDDLATAGQPTEEQLSAVRSHGFEVVVNLGLQDPKYCLPDEARTVAALGMSYHQIPVDIQNPTVADFEAFQRVMRESRGRRIFVHCAANIRVSCFVALLGESDLGWSREQADGHIKRLWRPNEVWAEFLRAVRAGRKTGA